MPTPLRASARPKDQVRVLLVDDDPFQCEAQAELLRGLGYRDITATDSGPAALAAITKAGPTAFDLMLCDLHMPGMDGFEFMESVAQVGFAGALIIVSGQSGDVLHAAALVARLRRFQLLGSLAKPLERSALMALLATWY